MWARAADQEAVRSMERIFPLVAAIVWLAPTSGCGGLGLYRAAGHIPGVAPSDYAFYNFCGTSSQLYQFSPPEVEGSTIRGPGRPWFPPCRTSNHICRREKRSSLPSLLREVGR